MRLKLLNRGRIPKDLVGGRDPIEGELWSLAPFSSKVAGEKAYWWLQHFVRRGRLAGAPRFM